MTINRIIKNKNLITTIACILIVFTRSIFGVSDSFGVIANLIVDALVFLYCLCLFLSDKQFAKRIIFSTAIVWILAFLIMEKTYAMVGLGYFFSMRYAILTMGAGVLIMFMLRYSQGYTLDIITTTGEVVILATFIFLIRYDMSAWMFWFQGIPVRFGTIPNGTVIDTANLYLVMLIPILYQMIIMKKVKRYLPIVVLTFFLLVAAGSKAALFATGMIIVYLLMFNTKTKMELAKNLGIIVAISIVGAVLVFKVPLLYDLMGERIVELINGFGSNEYNLHTSTGQRKAALAAAWAHWDEKPVFGHGFYAFKTMPYSALTESNITDETVYLNMHTHMNFMELLFSFGIFGVCMYYWFPVKLTIDTFRCKVKNTRLLVFSYLMAFVVVNIGLDMFYKYLSPYFAYLVCYCLLKEAHEK